MTVAFLFSKGWLDHLLESWGYPAVFLFVSAESIGVPVPGETMLILAALYAGSTHKLSIYAIFVIAAGAAIIGDNIGYGIGRLGGYRLLSRHGHLVHVDERRLKIGRYLFDRHGGKVVFFGRFVAILRTYSAFLAGTTRMHWLKFLVFNAAGGIVWAAIFCFAYYAFGRTLERLQTPADIALVVIAVAALVIVFRYVRRKEHELGERAEAAYPDESSTAIAPAARAAPPESTGA
jgi:membrane protein DedA with SNARE-associated domain